MISSVLLVIVSVLLIVNFTWRKRNKKKLPPGPFAWPFIGNLHLLRQLSRDFGGQHLAFLELSRRYNSDLISLKLGRNRITVVSGDKGIQYVLKNGEFDGRPWDEFIKLRNMGLRKGITMSDGPEWKEIRGWFVRTFRELGFGKSHMFHLIRDELVEILENLGEGGVRYLKSVTMNAVINVLWRLTAGKRFSDEKKLKYFIDLMDRRAKAFSMGGGILSSIPWIRYIAPEASGYNLLMTLNKELKSFFTDTIEDHKKNFKPGKDNDLIDMFLQEMYFGKGPSAGFTEDQLVLILMDIFIAGTLTTTTTLDFIFLNVLIHQDVQRKLHEEIDSIIGREKLPEINDRQSLPYLEAVCAESQRLCLVTPTIGPRRVLRDTELLGYYIPKNSTILINVYSSNTCKIRYKDPTSFNPERFIENGLYQHDETLILFGQGKRRCPGEILAKSAIFLLSSGVLQNFELHPVPGQELPSLKIVPGLTISPKPYEVLLKRRKQFNE
ncbi:probable cytochrome P450 305a1 [Leptopilina heterotoma]|uniref:probable cytochrome P450 305a1 n=1 Tax=Leptopilina heterotoma TaxID=63436 RepID=UPI001CA9D9CC|nr:probable cytochrome P450 305a1 [Leptopilina heterotoma]